MAQAIKMLQIALRQHGLRDYENRQIVVDGILGARTRSAMAKARDWQTWLNANGFNAGRVDGWPGKNTDAAIKRFQTKAIITVDGIIGLQTITARASWKNRYRFARTVRVGRALIDSIINRIRYSGRKWKGICVHYDAASAILTAESINRMHRARGWRKGGYHFYIERDGKLRSGQTDPTLLRKIGEIGAHVLWHNRQYVGIAYNGLTPNLIQYETLVGVIRALQERGHGYKYGIKGHREIAATACPGGLNENKLRAEV